MYKFKLIGLLVVLISLQACLFDEESDSEVSSSSVKNSSSESKTESSVESSSQKESSSSSATSSSEKINSSSSEMISSETLTIFNALAWIGSDYTSGALYTLDKDLKQTNLALNISQDSRVISISNEKVVVLERSDADNILLYDLKGDSVIYQVSLEAGANAYDADLLPNGNLVVPYFNLAKLVEINLKNGKVLQTLDLSKFSPEGVNTSSPNDVLVYQGKVYVTLQRLDVDWKAHQSILVEVNAKNFAQYDTLLLKGFNPYDMEIINEELIIAFKGNTSYDADWQEISAKDGSIEKVNLMAKTSSTLITEVELGGKPTDLEVFHSQILLSLYKKFGDQTLVEINFQTKKVTSFNGVVDASGGMQYSEALDLIFIGDRNYLAPGIFTFDGTELKALATKNGLAPYHLTTP